MKLLELIPFLKTFNEAERCAKKQLPDTEFDLIQLYMKNGIDIESDIAFFDGDIIPGNMLIEVNGIQYVSLFPLYMAQEIVEAHITENMFNNCEIAERMIEYRIYDA